MRALIFSAIAVGSILLVAFWVKSATVPAGALTTTLTCEKPLADIAVNTPDKLLAAGMYQNLGDGTYLVAEMSTTTKNQFLIPSKDLQKYVAKGFVEAPLKDVYYQSCNDGTHYGYYEVTKVEYDTYNKDAPPTKTEPVSKWQ